MFAPDVLDPAVERLQQLATAVMPLEFAIGTGRVAIPLRERGVKVSGIDIAPAMVAQLRSKVDAATIPVVVGDMTKAQVPGDYALVYLVFNGISNLLTQAEQVECFRNAARHLSPGGRFVHRARGADDPASCRSAGRRGPVLRWLPAGRYRRSRRAAPRLAPLSLRGRRGGTALPVAASLRLAGRTRLMGQLAGFTLESRHADWRGSPFTAASRSHISVYRRGEIAAQR